MTHRAPILPMLLAPPLSSLPAPGHGGAHRRGRRLPRGPQAAPLGRAQPQAQEEGAAPLAAAGRHARWHFSRRGGILGARVIAGVCSRPGTHTRKYLRHFVRPGDTIPRQFLVLKFPSFRPKKSRTLTTNKIPSSSTSPPFPLPLPRSPAISLSFRVTPLAFSTSGSAAWRSAAAAAPRATSRGGRRGRS